MKKASNILFLVGGILSFVWMAFEIIGGIIFAIFAGPDAKQMIIDGLNNGTITSCEVTGGLTADSSVGGIAGKNRGVIDSCVNRAHINTSVDDSRIGVEEIRDIMENILLTKSLNNAENLRTRIDVGGIAGFNMSGGTVTGCTKIWDFF